MNKRIIVISCAILLSILSFSPQQASAAEEEKSQWSITPLLWQSKYEDVSAYVPGIISTKNESMDIDFYGITARYNPTWSDKFEFILTGYTGEGDIEMTLYAAPSTFIVTTIDVGREDLELLARHNLWDKSRAYLLYGYRWMHLDESFVIAPLSFSGEYEYNFLELGYGFSSPVNATGSVNAFGNFILGFGELVHELNSVKDIDQQASMLDVNMGMQWAITDNLSFNARYRGVKMGYDFDFDNSDRVTFIHGFEIGGSVSF